MRILLQRVKWAKVRVEDKVVGSIGNGLCLFVGIGANDTLKEVRDLAEKVSVLRVFSDDTGKMNRSIADIGGEILAVSQFTLYADTSKGRRPSFVKAKEPIEANELYLQFVSSLRSLKIEVATGVFQADMDVELCNWGPVTLLLEKEPILTNANEL